MTLYDGGYNTIQYDPHRLRETAKRLSKRIPEVLEDTGASLVVVTGKSGVSLGFATLMLIDFPLVVVRKPGESSHGLPVEGKYGTVLSDYIILDDFIASGETVERVIESIDSYVLRKCDGLEMVQCRGVIQYSRDQQLVDQICQCDTDYRNPRKLPMFGLT